jgi:hypothetical protein
VDIKGLYCNRLVLLGVTHSATPYGMDMESVLEIKRSDYLLGIFEFAELPEET